MLRILDVNNNSSVCDRIEIELLIGKNSILTKNDIKSKIESYGIHKEDEEFEGDIDIIFDKLKIRLEIYNNFKPYKVEKNKVSSLLYKNIYDPIYYIFLLFLVQEEYSKINYNIVGKLFEKLTGEALIKYLGKGSTYYVTGHGSISKSKTLKSGKVKQICNFILEEFIKELPPKRKDKGLDVIALKKLDKRFGKIIIFNQSTSGMRFEKERENKMGQLKVDHRKSYINFTVLPIKSFSCPGFYDYFDKEDLFERNVTAGIILDRGSLINLLSSSTEFFDKRLMLNIEEYLKKVIH